MRFQVYCDKKHEWRWRFRARNGRIIADSGEGYCRKAGCLAAIKRVRFCMRWGTRIEVIE